MHHCQQRLTLVHADFFVGDPSHLRLVPYDSFRSRRSSGSGIHQFCKTALFQLLLLSIAVVIVTFFRPIAEHILPPDRPESDSPRVS